MSKCPMVNTPQCRQWKKHWEVPDSPPWVLSTPGSQADEDVLGLEKGLRPPGAQSSQRAQYRGSQLLLHLPPSPAASQLRPQAPRAPLPTEITPSPHTSGSWSHWVGKPYGIDYSRPKII